MPNNRTRRYLNELDHPDFQPMPEDVWALTLPEIVAWRGRQQPDHLALADAEQAFTYAELNTASNRVAHAILKEFPRPTDVVTAMLGRGAWVGVALLGALKAGRVFSSLEPSFPISQLRQILELLNPSAVLVDEPYVEIAASLGVKAIRLREALAGGEFSDAPPQVKLDMEGDYAIVFTSGSTGASKGVATSKVNRLSSARLQIEQARLGPYDRVAHLGNPNFAGGQGNILTTLMAGGAHIHYDVKAQGLAGFGTWVDANRITTIKCQPSLFREFAPRLSGARLDGLRLVSAGADKLARSDFDLFVKSFPPGCVLGTGFASSEAGAVTRVFFRAGDTFDDDQLPAGYPHADVDLFIWDDRRRSLPVGEVGEIVVHTPRLTSGYLGNEALNREKFLPHPEKAGKLVCLTGDLGWVTEDGLLYVTGRKDFQVKLRGMNVNMQEVSAALLAHPQVSEAAVYAHTDSQGSKRLAAYLVCREPRPSLRNLRQFLQDDLAPYKIPAYFIFLDTLPKLPNGKIHYTSLPRPDGQRPALATEFQQPRSALEAAILPIWEEALDMRPLGVEDDFHELGGDSLQAARIFIEINRQLGHYLPPAVLYSASTIAMLANAIETGQHETINQSFLVPIQQGSGPQSPLVFFVTPQRGDVMGYSDIIRHLPPDFTMYGFNSWTMAQKEWNNTTLPQLAARYVAEIERLAQGRPVILGGHSLGGLIAYEMAHQMEEKGLTVNLLFMMDTSGPGYVGNSLFSMSLKYLGKHVAAMNARERVQFVLRRLRGLPGYGVRLANMLARRLGREPVRKPAQPGAAGRSLTGNYRPPTIAAPVLFFRSTADRANTAFDDSRGWTDVLKDNLTVRFIPGDHFTHLLQASGAEIARQLASAVRAAHGQIPAG